MSEEIQENSRRLQKASRPLPTPLLLIVLFVRRNNSVFDGRIRLAIAHIHYLLLQCVGLGMVYFIRQTDISSYHLANRRVHERQLSPPPHTRNKRICIIRRQTWRRCRRYSQRQLLQAHDKKPTTAWIGSVGRGSVQRIRGRQSRAK